MARGHNEVVDDADTASEPLTRKNLGKVQYPRWVWAFGLVGAIVVVACLFAISQINETNAVDTGNGAIEKLVPAPATQILSQAEVGVDLAPGYTAELSLNGIPIADDEVKRVDATNSVLFLPGPGKSVQEFTPGTNTITVRYWRIADGEGTAQSSTWVFEAL